MKSIFAGMALFGLVAASDTAPRTFNDGQCEAQCRAAHNQCRISTKNSPGCDAQLQGCLDSCRSRR